MKSMSYYSYAAKPKLGSGDYVDRNTLPGFQASGNQMLYVIGGGLVLALVAWLLLKR